MIKTRRNNIISYIFFILMILLQIIFLFKQNIFVNFPFVINNLHLYLTIPITLWGYSLFYRITDKKIKYLSLIYTILIIIWLFIKFGRDRRVDDSISLFLWYLYYIPLLINIYLLYEILRYSNNLRLKTSFNYYVLALTIILIMIVITNSHHFLVFKFKDINIQNDYTYGFMYKVIVIWIIFVGSLILYHAFRIYKNRNKIPLLFIFLIFLLYFVYNRGYVYRLPFLFTGDFPITTIIFMVYLLEICIRINLIPGKYYYTGVFKMGNLDLSIIDDKNNIIFNTPNSTVLNDEFFNSLNKNVKTQEFSLSNKSIIFKVNKIDGGYSVYTKNVQTINELMSQINDKSLIINRQNNILSIEEELSKKYLGEKVSDKLKNIVDQVIFKKLDNINYFTEMITGSLNSKYQDYRLLSYIKIYVGYCKNKSTLLLKEVNKEYIASDDFSIILHNTIQDSFSAGIQGQIFVNIEEEINMKHVQLFFDITQFILKKCIRFSETNVFIRIDKENNNYTYYSIIDTYDKKGNFIFKFDNSIVNSINNLDGNYNFLLEDNNVLMSVKVKVSNNHE